MYGLVIVTFDLFYTKPYLYLSCRTRSISFLTAKSVKVRLPVHASECSCVRATGSRFRFGGRRLDYGIVSSDKIEKHLYFVFVEVVMALSDFIPNSVYSVNQTVCSSFASVTKFTLPSFVTGVCICMHC